MGCSTFSSRRPRTNDEEKKMEENEGDNKNMEESNTEDNENEESTRGSEGLQATKHGAGDKEEIEKKSESTRMG